MVELPGALSQPAARRQKAPPLPPRRLILA